MAKTAEAPKFFSRYNRPETIASETGTNFDKVRNIIINDNGHKALVITGETNRYEKVQAHKEECLIENILTAATLDPSILNRREGKFADVTGMPKTLAEYQNLAIKLTQDFEKLPVNVRAKFDHSAEKYVMQYGSKEWGEAMGIVKEELKKEPEKAEEKKEEEVK